MKFFGYRRYMLALAAVVSAAAWDTSAALEVGDAYKDFALQDSRGRMVTLGSVMEDADVTVLELLSVYCDACKKQTEMVNRIAADYRPQGVRVLGVALANEQHDVAAVTEAWGVRYPLLADPDKITYHLYSVHKVPQFFIIDKSGIIRYRGTADSGEAFEQTLDGLLAEKQQGLRVGDQAPAFSLLNEYGDHVDVRFESRHQNTILGFFSADDGFNRGQAQALAREYQVYKKIGLRVFGIFSGTFAGNIKKFIQDCSLNYPALMDKDGAVWEQYGVQDAPALIVINETGRIQRREHHKTYDELLAFFAKAEPRGARKDAVEESIAFLRQALPDVLVIKPVGLADETIFIGMDEQGEKFAARFVRKDILCEVCADVYFVQIMDAQGVYQDILLVTPFEVYGKPVDATAFLQQFVGKSYHEHFEPGVNVDIISGATKSSQVLIEGLNETEEVFAQYLKDPAFDANFRKQVCFLEQGELEVAIDLYSREHVTPAEDIEIGDVASYCPGEKLPECPLGGTYKIILFNNIPRVMCTVHGLDPDASTYTPR